MHSNKLFFSFNQKTCSNTNNVFYFRPFFYHRSLVDCRISCLLCLYTHTRLIVAWLVFNNTTRSRVTSMLSYTRTSSRLVVECLHQPSAGSLFFIICCKVFLLQHLQNGQWRESLDEKMVNKSNIWCSYFNHTYIFTVPPPFFHLLIISNYYVSVGELKRGQ